MNRRNWLNRNIFAMGLTSFFSDFGHEMATAILPMFLVSVGGSAALLGVIEGVADASVSFMKLLSGWYSDFIGRRKPFAVIGYFLTAVGVGSFALASSWTHILISRLVSWIGRGTRGAPIDALLVDSTEPAYYGRVFGFHRGMDTLGAILGPALAFFLIKFMPLRPIFLVALIPSILAFLTVAFLVKEKVKVNDKRTHLIGSLKLLPLKFRLFLVAVGIFGLGNFADSLLILRATQLLTPAKGAIVAGSLAILFYTFRNIFYAAFCFIIGALADKLGKKQLLVFGYLLTGITSLGFILNTTNILYLGLLFLLAGVAIAITDALERTVAADLLPEQVRGTGYGVLAAVNGIGDFGSSVIVGFLWSAISPTAGFGYGAVMAIIGGLILFSIRKR